MAFKAKIHQNLMLPNAKGKQDGDEAVFILYLLLFRTVNPFSSVRRN